MLRMTSATSFTTTLRQRERDSVCVREIETETENKHGAKRDSATEREELRENW